jgi:hypothetical protein
MISLESPAGRCSPAAGIDGQSSGPDSDGQWVADRIRPDAQRTRSGPGLAGRAGLDSMENAGADGRPWWSLFWDSSPASCPALAGPRLTA